MRPENWLDLMEVRLWKAESLGWTAEHVGGTYWLMNDPDGRYSGFGDSYTQAFYDVLADEELWDEVTAALEGSK